VELVDEGATAVDLRERAGIPRDPRVEDLEQVPEQLLVSARVRGRADAAGLRGVQDLREGIRGSPLSARATSSARYSSRSATRTGEKPQSRRKRSAAPQCSEIGR
jgi:hypothetical protein